MLLTIFTSYFEKYLFRSFAHFSWVICSLNVKFLNFLCFLDFNPLSDEYLEKIFLPFCSLSLHSVNCFLCCTELLISSNPICQSLFLFLGLLESYLKYCRLANILKNFPFSSSNFRVSGLTLSCLIHFGLFL